MPVTSPRCPVVIWVRSRPVCSRCWGPWRGPAGPAGCASSLWRRARDRGLWVLAGARSYVAIAEWASDLTPAVRLRWGLGRGVACESTIRRLLQRVDAEPLDKAVSS
ncbi:MAG: transposase family protein [Actinomycetes bacterium]